jgi:hypothetical protein
VELSLRRLSATNRERVRVLGVFHGGVDLDVLRAMTGWEPADVGGLARELVGTGLATPNPYNHLSLNPALCPYLKATLSEEERQALTAGWLEAMAAYLRYLNQQQSQNTELAATLTLLELPNLFALLDRSQADADPATTIDRATSLYGLLKANRGCWSGWLGCAMPPPPPWARGGRTHPLRPGAPASSSSWRLGSCGRPWQAQSSFCRRHRRRGKPPMPVRTTTWRLAFSFSVGY